MERLTIDEAIKKAREVAKKNREAEALFLCDDCIWNAKQENKLAEEHEQLAEWLEKLKEYKQAEEDGLLIKLPCPIGSTIYKFEYPSYVDADGKEWTTLDGKRATVAPLKFALCHLNRIGDLYYLTKEEAEQALAKMKGE